MSGIAGEAQKISPRAGKIPRLNDSCKQSFLFIFNDYRLLRTLIIKVKC